MVFYERILDLINCRNITKNRLLTDLKINHNAFSKWRKPDSLPDGKNLAKLANYFEVSADYLLGLSDVKRPLAAPLTNEQAELLRMFDALDARDKADIVGLAASKYARYGPDKKSDTDSGVSSIA